MKKIELLFGILVIGVLLVLGLTNTILSEININSNEKVQFSKEITYNSNNLNPLDKFESKLINPLIGNPNFIF